MRQSLKLLAVLAIGVVTLGVVQIVVRDPADRRAGLDDPPSVVRVQDSVGIVLQRGVSVSFEQLATLLRSLLAELA